MAPEPTKAAGTEPARIAAPSIPTSSPLREPSRPPPSRIAPPAPAAAQPAPTRVEAPPGPVAAEAPPRPSLTDEVALIDDVLAWLRTSDPAGALKLLDRYDQQFPRGALAPEATVARIEALVASGNVARAKEIAARSSRRTVKARSPFAFVARSMWSEQRARELARDVRARRLPQ